MSQIKVVLVDDHDIVRAGIKSMINKDPAFIVVAEFCNGEEFLEKLKSLKCELLILDLSMPQVDGLMVLEKIRYNYPKIKVLILSMLKDHEHFKHAMAGGASGYLLKEETCEYLIIALKTILKGKSYVSPKISSVLTDRYLQSLDEGENACEEILTKRELQILKLIAQGFANKNIAAKLKISIRTVEHHRSNLTNKLGLKTTAALVKYALQKGLL